MFFASLRALGAVVALALLVTRPAPPPSAAKPHPATTPKKPSSSPAPDAAPFTAGPGLVVCEPIPDAPYSVEAELGTGCSMWLQLEVGGQPELGRTPLWSAISRARQELKRQDLRLRPSEARQLAGMTGATHAVVGEIKGTDPSITLTYRLLDLSSLKEVGPPLTAAGTREDLVTGLPRIAGALAERLGVKEPSLSKSVGAGSQDLWLLGRMGWRSTLLPDRPDTEQFRKLASRLPLAGLLRLRPAAFTGDQEVRDAAALLVMALPENALAYATVRETKDNVAQGFTDAQESLRQRFPHNQLLAFAGDKVHQYRKEWEAERQSALELTRCGPTNPEVWLTLGRSYGEEAERLRRARTAGEITPEEWKKLNHLYALWKAAVQKAADLDPLCGRAWQRLSVAATFAGDEARADAAFWKAVDLDQEERALVWVWGLEMYHPKWLGDPVKYQRVVDRALIDSYEIPWEALSVTESLGMYGLRNQQLFLLRRIIPLLESDMKQRPSSEGPREELLRAQQQLRGEEEPKKQL
jgi:hypothetical protein